MATISWSITFRCFSSFNNLFSYIQILVKKWKYGIRINDIITSNEYLENISIEIIELTNIDDSSHEQLIVIFITKTDLKKNRCLIDDDNGKCFEF